MSAAVKKEEQSVLLEAHASDEEVDALRRMCAACGCELVSAAAPADATAGRNPPRLLFIGRDMAARARERARTHTGGFGLLVARDEAVLDYPELLERCADVLVAPYAPQALAECLDALHRGEDFNPEVYENFIGRSPQMREMLRVLTAVARYDAPVLITGETGTGKELAARGIHYSSSRRDEPFVPVNCGALNDDLLLAELFGYEKGAFTDAKRSHRGLVAQAAGGVLFLDELDSLSLRGQAALLRFLQEQEYRPIGAEGTRRSNVRVVAATNKDIGRLAAHGQFREDLYYRVHLLDVELPPLRARDGDIAVLAEHFLADLSQRYAEPVKRLHPMTLRWMLEYDWPGNVRELQNYLYRVFVLTKGAVICAPRVKGNPLPWTGAPPADADVDLDVGEFRRAKEHALLAFERDYLRKVMAVAGGNISAAARHAGKERRAFRRLLKKHGIDRRTFDARAKE